MLAQFFVHICLMNQPVKELFILLADDDPVDCELFLEGIKDTGIKCKVHEVENGQLLLDYLSTADHYPDMIILDLNMPVKDGRETLKELKKTPAYKHIPVFILSTSNARFDVEVACHSGANMFLIKPHGYKEIVEMLQYLLTLYSKYAASCNV